MSLSPENAQIVKRIGSDSTGFAAGAVCLLRGTPEPRRAYRASNSRDVYDLAFTLESVKPDRQAAVAAAIIDAGLMIGPWWFRFLHGLMRMRGAAAARLTTVYAKFPEEARSLLHATASHMRHGRDREESTSIGGFSQREMNTLVKILGGG